MENEFIKCFSCDVNIPVANIPFFKPYPDSDIVCGMCIKKEYGEKSYDFFKSMAYSLKKSHSLRDN